MSAFPLSFRVSTASCSDSSTRRSASRSAPRDFRLSFVTVVPTFADAAGLRVADFVEEVRP